MMFRSVARASQPSDCLLVEQVDVNKLTPANDVVLYIFDHVLYLALALGVGLVAEHRIEPMFTDQGSEAVGKNQVAKVLIDRKHLVLVIDHFTGHSSKEPKSRLDINRKVVKGVRLK